MTYFGFLGIFLGIPLLILGLLTFLDRRRGVDLPRDFGNFPAWLPVIILVVVALTYTTPWDNYLVASGVWYYNPELVTGITIGWVPIEEYTFFMLQPILTGLWLLWLARRLPVSAESAASFRGLRWAVTAGLGILWLGSAALLFSGWAPGTYLGLILIWALPPIMLQTGFGGDILWRHRRLVGLAILSVTLYLAAADSLAINAGTWTIAPEQSVEIYLAGVLPLEEFVFFLITNVLIVFGITLALAAESRERLDAFVSTVTRRPAKSRTDLDRLKTGPLDQSVE